MCQLQILSAPTFFNSYIEFLERNTVHTNWRIYVVRMGSLTRLPHFLLFAFLCYMIYHTPCPFLVQEDIGEVEIGICRSHLRGL